LGNSCSLSRIRKKPSIKTVAGWNWLARNRAADDAWITAVNCVESDRSPH
jgi:hypothetical protein